MTKAPRGWQAAPLLLAAFSPLHLAASNRGEELLSVVLALTAAMVVFGAAISGAVQFALRQYPASVRILVASIVIVIGFWGPLIAENIELARHRLEVGTILMLGAGGIWFLLRRPQERPGLASGVFIFAFALMVPPLVRLASERSAARMEDLPSKYLPHIQTEFARQQFPVADPDSLRDIYLIILDEYANREVLRSRFDFDNGPFEDSLRALGFVIPAHSRSNYVTTAHSLSSMLNASHIDGLPERLGEHSRDWRPLIKLVQNNHVTRILKWHGYRVYFQSSLSFPGTRVSPLADSVFRASSLSRPYFLLSRSQLLSHVYGVSLPGLALWKAGIAPRFSRATLSVLPGVEEIIPAPGPKFVIAHSMMTHGPFGVDAECNPARWAHLFNTALQPTYVEQVSCTNRQLLGLVRQIIAESDSEPIIILQGDHGTKRVDSNMGTIASGSNEVPPPEALWERFGAFGAYLAPGVPSATFADTVTPVNVFRIVFRHYFGAELSSLPNAAFHTSYFAPYLFHRVDHLLVGLEAGSLSSVTPRPPGLKRAAD